MKIINISILLSFLLLFSCSHGHDDGHNHSQAGSGGHSHGNATHEDGTIHLSKAQIETMGIQFGSFSDVKINDFINATGTLGLPPNATYSVSAKSSGFISDSKKFVEGSYVRKGEIMAYLENPEFITLQQKYLETAAELTYLEQELDRQQQLVDANAGVAKNLQKLQSEVQMKTATLKGLGKQLDYLGIPTGKITMDNIVERIAIFAPMTGYITSISLHNGMYVKPEMELLVVVNENHLHLELDVFEKDIALVEEELPISYTIPALGNTIYKGEVHVIGKEFNPENKTVRVHGHLEKDRPKFIKDLFIEAKIWLSDQTVKALPEKAIMQDGDNSYIYAANGQFENEELKFEAIRVIAGITEDGFTSVKLIDQIPPGMEVVTNGAYYVFAQSKAGQLTHEH